MTPSGWIFWFLDLHYFRSTGLKHKLNLFSNKKIILQAWKIRLAWSLRKWNPRRGLQLRPLEFEQPPEDGNRFVTTLQQVAVCGHAALQQPTDCAMRRISGSVRTSSSTTSTPPGGWRIPKCDQRLGRWILPKYSRILVTHICDCDL